MKAKTFEIRDKGTFIPVLAIQLDPDGPEDTYLLDRAGYWRSGDYTVVVMLEGSDGELRARCDYYGWSVARTMDIAHRYIRDHFALLENGEVIDVQYILGETNEPKMPERLTE